jgi:hypothetical protein
VEEVALSTEGAGGIRWAVVRKECALSVKLRVSKSKKKKTLKGKKL